MTDLTDLKKSVAASMVEVDLLKEREANLIHHSLKLTWTNQTTSHHHCHRSVHQATAIHTNIKPIQWSTPTNHWTNHHFTTIDPRESFGDFSKSTIWERDFRALERWKREGDFGLRKRSLEIFVWVSKPRSTISLSSSNLQPFLESKWFMFVIMFFVFVILC